MEMTVGLPEARAAFTDSVDSFLGAVESFSEYDLLGVSRCHGWTRLDVVTHVIAGCHEMLDGMVSPVQSPPTVDAASYWPAFEAQYGDGDPVAVLMEQRRRTAVHARPESAVRQLRDVAAAVRRGSGALIDRCYPWQGHVFRAGDFLAVWAVENVVHHLDLSADRAAPASALRLATSTIEALIGEPLPSQWSAEQAVLIGTGRLPVPDEVGELARRLPAFS